MHRGRQFRRVLWDKLSASNWNVRATNYKQNAARRRSLPVPPLFDGSSGPLGRKHRTAAAPHGARAEHVAGHLHFGRAQDRPHHGEGRRCLPALRALRRTLPHRRLGHEEILLRNRAGRLMIRALNIQPSTVIPGEPRLRGEGRGPRRRSKIDYADKYADNYTLDHRYPSVTRRYLGPLPSPRNARLAGDDRLFVNAEAFARMSS